MPNIYIEVNPNPIRSLKSIAATVHGNSQSPTAQEFAYISTLKAGKQFKDGKKLSFEKECKREKLTDIEIQALEDWLKLEEAERARRQQDYQKKVDPLAQLPLEERIKVDSRLAGYIVLGCGHLRRRQEAFSISRPGVIDCIHLGCGKSFRYENEKMVEVKR